jgi:hypothetical protein
MGWRGPRSVLKLENVSDLHMHDDRGRHVLFEGTGGHVAAACAWLEVHPARSRDTVPKEAGRVPARNEFAVTGHAGGTAVKERATLWVFGVVSPIVIREGALVTTFLPQRLLKGPGELAMPFQEVFSAVDAV